MHASRSTPRGLCALLALLALAAPCAAVAAVTSSLEVGDLRSMYVTNTDDLWGLRIELCPSGPASDLCRRLTVRNSNASGQLSFRSEQGCREGGSCAAVIQDFDDSGRDFSRGGREVVVDWRGPAVFQSQAATELVVGASAREKIRLPIWPFTAGTLKIEAVKAAPGSVDFQYQGPPVVPSTTLLEGEKALVRVSHYSALLRGVRFLACDGAAVCSRLSLLQANPSMVPMTSLATWQGCNFQGLGCASLDPLSHEDRTWPALTSGELLFTVERFKDTLTVRLGDSEATLPVRPGATTLRVRPEEHWMHVHFQKVGTPRADFIVGDLKTVRANHGGASGVRFVFCSPIGLCRALAIRGYNATGGLNYRAAAGCSSEGTDCQEVLREFDACGACTDFQPGGLEFFAQWRGPAYGMTWEQTELLVWPRGRPQQKAVLPVWPWTVGELRVLAEGADSSDVDVKFDDTPVPELNMTTGDMATLHVGYLEAHGAVRFLLCNATECSRLSFGSRRYSGDMPLSKLFFSTPTFLQKCNLRGQMCQSGHSSVFPEPHVAPVLQAGELVFTAERRRGAVAVRLQGGPLQEAELHAPAGEVLALRVLPDTWAEQGMTVRFEKAATVGKGNLV